MKSKKWLLLGLIPAVFMLVSMGKAYASGNLDAYVQALEYGLLGLIEYFKFIVNLFQML